MPYQNYFTTIKLNFKKIHHHLFKNQLIELSSSSQIDIIQEGEVIFKKNTTIVADDDYVRVETCTDPCGLNRSDEAASTAADYDYACY